jgi:uncharacterized protein
MRQGHELKGEILYNQALEYKPPLWLRNGHVQSIWPSLFRTVDVTLPEQEVLPTDDSDELHLDWYRQGSSRLAVLSHGLEGHSRRPYIQGLARALLREGWDVLAWNFRSCGGVMNHQPRFYHSGATGDLDQVVRHGLAQGYQTVGLAGFSMGGNLTLLYLAEQSEKIDSRVCGGIAFSVPCDLAGSADTLARPSRKIYMQRFLRDLQVKMEEKSRRFPDLIDTTGFDRIQTFHEFDDRFTAPLHGFRDAQDYWSSCSALWRLKDIRVPALMVNASDDPFLSTRCFPTDPDVLGRHTRAEFPKWGGHVGFVEQAKDGYYWSERRAIEHFSRLLA